LRGLLGSNDKGCLEEMRFKMSFKCGKGFRIPSGTVERIPDSMCTYMKDIKY